MNFQPDKSIMENGFDMLKQQASSTFESWDDPVQKKFYEQFINPVPKEFTAFINELVKLDKSFELAEQVVNGLRE